MPLQGVGLSVDLPIWALTVEMWNHHSWLLDASTGRGVRSASWSANMSSNSRNLKLPFLATRYPYWGVDLPVDLPIWALNSRNVKLPFLITRCLNWGVDLPVDLPNFNTLCVSCFASQRSNCLGTWSIICFWLILVDGIFSVNFFHICQCL